MSRIPYPLSQEPVLGYPIEESSQIDIPEGLNPESVSGPDSIQVIPVYINKKLCIRLVYCSYLIKLCSVLDFIWIIFYILGNNEGSGLIISFPIFGYCGARYFHKGLITIYSLYLLLVLVYKLYLIVLINDKDLLVQLSFSCFFKLSLFIICCYFIVNLTRVKKAGRHLLRIASGL